MRRFILSGRALAAILIAAFAAAPLAQDKSDKSSSAKDAPGATLVGQWRFNKALSEEPTSDTAGLSPRPPDPGGVQPIGGGGMGGGTGGGFGGGIGGRGGGIGTGGGIPGMGSPGVSNSGFGRNNSEETLQVHAMVREMNQPPDGWTIAASGQVVTFTATDGTVRKYTANGRKEKVDLTSARIETVTTWNAAQHALTQAMKVGRATMTRTIQASTQGNQLIVTIVAQTDDRDVQAASRRFIFDRAAGTRP